MFNCAEFLLDPDILILLKTACYCFVAGFSAQGVDDGFEFTLFLAFLYILVLKE